MHNYKVHTDHHSFDLTEADTQSLDIVKRNDVYHVLDQGKNCRVELLELKGKSVTLKLNGAIHKVQISDTVDQIVVELGLDQATEIRMADVKAPMPGLLLDIMVQPGQAVSAGDPLLILEAMKMENIIKAIGDGVVKSVLLAKGAAVEKNEVILEME